MLFRFASIGMFSAVSQQYDHWRVRLVVDADRSSPGTQRGHGVVHGAANTHCVGEACYKRNLLRAKAWRLEAATTSAKVAKHYLST
mmetsp:Transcript_81889/g.171312  ORF Transcript_81889/g.171312 Transcript_81889/m.171312 type:complete len:86 (+) Transcript_81889:1748-2005(+)